MFAGSADAPFEGMPRDAEPCENTRLFVRQSSQATRGVNHAPTRRSRRNTTSDKRSSGLDTRPPGPVPQPLVMPPGCAPVGARSPLRSAPAASRNLRIGCRLAMRFCRRAAGELTIRSEWCRRIDPLTCTPPEVAASGFLRKSGGFFGVSPPPAAPRVPVALRSRSVRRPRAPRK